MFFFSREFFARFFVGVLAGSFDNLSRTPPGVGGWRVLVKSGLFLVLHLEEVSAHMFVFAMFFAQLFAVTFA